MFRQKARFSLQKAVLLGLFFLLTTSANATPPKHVANSNTAAIRVTPDYCLGISQIRSIDMCNQIIPLTPYTVNEDGTATVAMPSPFNHESFTFECVQNLPSQQYQVLVIDAPTTLCTLQRCSPGNVNLCGAVIPVNAEITINQQTEVMVPPTMLANADNNAPALSFTAQCVDDGQGNPTYVVTDSSQVSCNAFPCPDTSFTICATSIPVPGGATMGTVLDLQMPLPFSPDPFKVECVGNPNGAPAYQLSESSAVSCGMLPATQ